MAETILIAARALTYATLLPAAGLPLYGITARGAVTGRGRRAIAALAALALLASAWWALTSVAAMTALPIGALDRATVSAVLAATPLGGALEVRALALLALGAIALSRLPLALAAPAGVAALATCAFTGHAGATEGALGTLHRVADTAHLAAAACWIGALLSLLAGLVGRESAERLEPRLAGFALTGSVLVCLLLASGVTNMLLIAGWPPPLASGWTLLLIAKLALFALMLGLAGLNRWRLTPALARGMTGARGHLRASLLIETVCGFCVFALVAALGLLDPAGGAAG